VSIDVRAPAYRVLADDLRSQITSGQLRPGDRLPTEPQLCRDCGVSRSTVREALRLLASQHLIVTTRGVAGGSFVAHPSLEQLSETLATGVNLLHINAVVDVMQLMEVRSIFEVAAAGFAALRRRPEDLDALRGTLFDPHTADLETMCDKHPAFHTALVAACGNPVLELVTTPLFQVANIREVLSGFKPDFWFQIDADHRAIFGAVSAGDAAGAEAAAARHLDYIRTVLMARRDEPAVPDAVLATGPVAGLISDGVA
jgi:DNA-binding FadR family transcriptional regulator